MNENSVQFVFVELTFLGWPKIVGRASVVQPINNSGRNECNIAIIWPIFGVQQNISNVPA